ncbi:2,3-bisphosphoglycerate-independent phosphoglycerate mutase [uncultured archaeon]|nr:2,3-bisphosphoglycerate-independent phosphoglycerate mutase [uncultured archaeon]
MKDAIRPVVLIVMDGWGIRKERKGNAIAMARPRNFLSLWKEYPHATLKAHGEFVGLPKGIQGNSEIGHLNIGSGRIPNVPLVRINKAIKDGSFFRNRTFVGAIDHCRKRKSRLHLMGLVQDQWVHAHQDHLFALLELCAKERFRDVDIHFISDGRDTPPKSALRFLAKLESVIRRTGVGRISTVIGRYYAMDRDNRWERTRLAYSELAGNPERRAPTARDAISQAYRLGETDEFIRPTAIGDFDGIKDGDSVIFFNYRLDRARQITKAFVEKRFKGFERKRMKEIYYVAMSEYYKGMPAHVAFKPTFMRDLLGEIVSRKGIRQLRISETEKYAHVTFFFNGQVEAPNKGEDRILIPSLKVPTYDLKPEMRAHEISDRLVSEIGKGKYGVIVCNLVNCDMVGHTGVLPATVKAVKVVDQCIGEIATAAIGAGGAAIITADHGNAELKLGKKNETLTAHTANDVPFILVTEDPGFRNAKLRKGDLTDIAPTVLELLGIRKPKAMTGRSLILRRKKRRD